MMSSPIILKRTKESLTKQLAEQLEKKRNQKSEAITSPVPVPYRAPSFVRPSSSRGASVRSSILLSSVRESDGVISIIDDLAASTPADSQETSQTSVPFSNSALRSLFGSI